jgi:hypothetical protein
MGRNITEATVRTPQSLYPLSGPFGRGVIEFFYNSGTFTVPAGVTTVRARVWGGGGASNTGGTSSFGAHCSATGGLGTTFVAPISGGSGSGGDVNFTGGQGSNTSAGSGGAASLLGNGGSTSGGSAASGGGGSSGAASTPGGRGGSGITGTPGQPALSASVATTPASGFVFGVDSIDLIGTGSGGAGAGNTNVWPGSAGVNGGGGGGGTAGAAGGFPGGGGSNGGGGGGFSMKTVTGLTPGSTVSVTVGAGAASNTTGSGLVIVEY